MLTIFLEYFYWHFAIAPREILKIMQNYLTATWHQFLITQHFKTLFAPWHRQNPSDFGPRSRTFSDKIFDALADLYIRLIAAGIRLTIIAMGFLWQIFLAVGFMLVFVIWLGWPIISIYMIIKGFAML